MFPPFVAPQPVRRRFPDFFLEQVEISSHYGLGSHLRSIPAYRNECHLVMATGNILHLHVKITLKSGTVTKRIVGRNATHLITIDNELIPITDVVDIERK